MDISRLFCKQKEKTCWEQEGTMEVYKLYRTHRAVKPRPVTKQERREVQARRCTKRARRCLRVLRQEQESCKMGFKLKRDHRVCIKRARRKMNEHLHKNRHRIVNAVKMKKIESRSDTQNKSKEANTETKTGLAVWYPQTRSRRRHDRILTADLCRGRKALTCDEADLKSTACEEVSDERVEEWQEYDLKKGKDIVFRPEIMTIGPIRTNMAAKHHANVHMDYGMLYPESMEKNKGNVH